ncbi:hypothetical protein Cpir12675_004174 [Ceratocystis pirilliformis]|uniref:BZIP domain-containing protein n=1 Tax=Ceratocystis pirilliformis TaxID=259994 RepID=A0ABR3YYD0_9PEZI
MADRFNPTEIPPLPPLQGMNDLNLAGFTWLRGASFYWMGAHDSIPQIPSTNDLIQCPTRTIIAFMRLVFSFSNIIKPYILTYMYAHLDGQIAKRRGPKPDSRPAMTRRQQLNRQAQRTHRERKEQYIRNLEDEVTKLRSTLLENSKEKELIMNVNKMLRNVLADSGIPLPPRVANSLAHVDSMMMADARNISNQTNMQTFTPTGQTPIVSPSQQDVTSYPGGIPGAPSIPRPMLEQEQAGIEFVLTYDNQDRARAYLSPPPQ